MKDRRTFGTQKTPDTVKQYDLPWDGNENYSNIVNSVVYN